MDASSSSDAFDAATESAGRNPQSGNTPPSARPFHIRGFASLLLLCSFPVLALSGVVLYVAPRGRYANWNAWTMLGLRRDQWSAIHINLSLLFLVIALLHLLINWRAMIAYVRRRRVAGLYLKSELVCSLALLAALLASTLANVLPFQAVIDVRYRIRNSWERPTETIEPVMRESRMTIDEIPNDERDPDDEEKTLNFTPAGDCPRFVIRHSTFRPNRRMIALAD